MMERKSEYIACELIQDLLPLYVDEACSKESNRVVEQHLNTCDHCRGIFIAMKEDVQLPLLSDETPQQDIKNIESLAKVWKKTTLRSWIKGVVIATLCCTLLVVGYVLLTSWTVIPVPASKFEVTDVYQLSDGSISYRLSATDGFEVNHMTTTYDKEGNSYKLSYRPLIKKKAATAFGLHDQLLRIDPKEEHVWLIKIGQKEEDVNATRAKATPSIEVRSEGAKDKAWYYGTEDNRILIWKTGMDVPKASEELEQYWLGDHK